MYTLTAVLHNEASKASVPLSWFIVRLETITSVYLKEFVDTFVVLLHWFTSVHISNSTNQI